MRNKRYLLCLLAGVLMGGGTGTFAQGAFESAADAVKEMRLGWNLGNTLDSNSGDTLNMWIEHWTDRLPSSYETAWGQPVATEKLVSLFKAAGFNAIRVPVTWYPHMEAKFKFSGYDNSYWYPAKDDIGSQVNSAWMKRVHEVVDYVVSQGMYCILNVHHDTGASNTAWLVADSKTYERRHKQFEAVWRQIAEEFKDYDDHLLFEGYNEMLDVKRSWCFASYGTSNRYDATIAADAYKSINNYAQSFVDAVRSTGGNNTQRNLIVSTYGACSGAGSWNSHLVDPLKNLLMPRDVTEGHLITEIHTYPSISNLTSAKNEMTAMLKNLKTYFTDKGFPVIVGEWGTSDSEDYAKRRAATLEFARFFVEQAKSYGIGTFYWMGLSDGEDRSVPRFTQADLVDAIVKGYYGEGGYDASMTLTEAPATEPVVYDLMGRRIPAGTPLTKGIYIVDGKKTMVAR